MTLSDQSERNPLKILDPHPLTLTKLVLSPFICMTDNIALTKINLQANKGYLIVTPSTCIIFLDDMFYSFLRGRGL
jgi:hypothetical protein